jgi:hypothetical protein
LTNHLYDFNTHGDNKENDMTYATAKRFNLLNYTSAIVTRQDLNPFTSLVPSSCPIKALKVLYNSPQLLGIVLLSKAQIPSGWSTLQHCFSARLNQLHNIPFCF